jgi:hypothetical protein
VNPHPEGINWQLIHELLLAELKRFNQGASDYMNPKQWWLDELNRNNNIAVEKAMKQQ